MPFRTEPPGHYGADHKLPHHLQHKPVYALPYQDFEEMYGRDTDMRYISVGMAQYDPDHVSIKAMRHVQTRWSPQSEELPLHRVIDMTLFLAKVVFDSHAGHVTFPPDTFQDQAAALHVTQEQDLEGLHAAYEAFLPPVLPSLQERLLSLAAVLDDLRARNRL